VADDDEEKENWSGPTLVNDEDEDEVEGGDEDESEDEAAVVVEHREYAFDDDGDCIFHLEL
jgi:hypothetical protein